MSEENNKTTPVADSEVKSTPAASQPGNSFESGTTHLKQGAEDLRNATEAKLKEIQSLAEAKAKELKQTAEAKAKEIIATAEVKAAEYYEKAKVALNSTSEKTKVFREESETLIRKNPVGTVLGALAVGFVLGLVFRKD